jgi:hypothetical protein
VAFSLSADLPGGLREGYGVTVRQWNPRADRGRHRRREPHAEFLPVRVVPTVGEVRVEIELLVLIL